MLKYGYILFIALGFAACNNNEKDIPPPEIFLKMPNDGFDFDTDSAVVIEPKITYDINSEYAWYEEGITEAIHNDKDYTFENRALGLYRFIFSVETPYGSDTMHIKVHSLDINSFEEFDDFNENGYNNTPENNLHQFKYVQYPCLPGTPDADEWSGFAVSKNASTSNSASRGEFSAYGRTAAEESDNFMIFKQQDGYSNRISFADNKAHTLKSIALNNCTRSYLYMQSGFNKKEGKDYFLLTITGYDSAGNPMGTPAKFLLADYRPQATADKFIVSEWEELSLSELGAVHQLGFQLSSSRDDDAEFELPMYFCLDNLKISK
ncbi:MULTISPECIES: DUF4465 domain-containing protein [unclassified Carboxylicivirga]|uniref:DUF4465 domain-containing protein n=1 Tax=Carboxylicivirga TaxID=1628153 RepID=UPI003D34310F